MVLKQVVKEYLQNSTLHGAKYIIAEDSNWVEKLFWIISISASWFASGLLIYASLDAFRNNAITFVVETSYLDWDTDFPAIIVCETKNLDRIQEISNEIWGEDHEFILEEILSEITYFRGESYHTVNECAEDNPIQGCSSLNFSHHARKSRSLCESTIGKCSWNDELFDCCKYFQAMNTEIGVCYAINSIQVENLNGPRLNMISNRFTMLGTLKMNVFTESSIYILGEEDVPTVVTPKADILLTNPSSYHKRLVSVKNIANADGTRAVDVEQRKCRFNDENDLDTYRFYSYSACIAQCRKEKQLMQCNCTSHLTPNTPPSLHCNITGMKCLNLYYEELTAIIPHWTQNRRGIKCNCLPSCTEVDISVVHDIALDIEFHEETFAKVEIGLSELPTERYKRNVVRGKLDLVVSIGGTTGLFVGASLLSFVEIIYYFTIRPYGTVIEKRRK